VADLDAGADSLVGEQRAEVRAVRGRAGETEENAGD